MKIKNAEYFAEMYFILRMYRIEIDPSESSGNYKDDVEKYCQDLLKNPHIRDRISTEMAQEMVPSNMEHIIR